MFDNELPGFGSEVCVSVTGKTPVARQFGRKQQRCIGGAEQPRCLLTVFDRL